VTSFRSPGRFLTETVEGIVLFFALVTTWPIVGRWLRDWGSTPEERARCWPGDDLTEDPVDVFTRGVSVNAGPQAVWPWLVQFGLGRAGFYSYEFLERVAGIPVRNVEQILPEHQVLRVGDEIRLHPDAPGIPVGKIDPGRCLCFGSPADPDDTDAPDPRRSWSLYVEPRESGGSRLVLRSCIEAPRSPTLAKRIGLAAEVPVDFLMEQRMLRTIKRLVESNA
jgi:hypothetical protein